MSAPAPKEIIELSKERGYLAKQLYVIFTTPTNGIAPVLEHLQQYLEYQELLERKGVMFAAGPHWSDDEQRWEGDGMVVVRAGSLAEADAIAKRTRCTRAARGAIASVPGWSMRAQYRSNLVLPAEGSSLPEFDNSQLRAEIYAAVTSARTVTVAVG
jgi:uncharacterized protein YciI